MVFAQGHLFFLMCCERSMEVWHLHQVWKCFDLFLELGEAENLRCFLAPVAMEPDGKHQRGNHSFLMLSSSF